MIQKDEDVENDPSKPKRAVTFTSNLSDAFPEPQHAINTDGEPELASPRMVADDERSDASDQGELRAVALTRSLFSTMSFV